MSHRTRTRSAFTLLELVVVLAITGLALAVVAPSLVIRPLGPDEQIQQVINAARRAAARRAQTLSLDVTADGAWGVTATAGNTLLMKGKLDAPVVRAFRVRISPIGMCAPENDSVSAQSAPLDPLDCRWRDSATQSASRTR